MAQSLALLMRFPIPFVALFVSLLFTQAPSQDAPAKAPSLHFEDVPPQAGLTIAHRSSREQHYIIESMSGGVGLFDCDDDGKLDILVVNGAPGGRYRTRGVPLGTRYLPAPAPQVTEV